MGTDVSNHCSCVRHQVHISIPLETSLSLSLFLSTLHIRAPQNHIQTRILLPSRGTVPLTFSALKPNSRSLPPSNRGSATSEDLSLSTSKASRWQTQLCDCSALSTRLVDDAEPSACSLSESELMASQTLLVRLSWRLYLADTASDFPL